MHDEGILVPLPPGPLGLQHEGVHAGGDLPGRQLHLVRHARGEADPLGGLRLALLVLGVLPEVESVA